MAKFKGKFCKKGKSKINQALDKGRETRWSNKDICSADNVPITVFNLDHGYATHTDSLNQNVSQEVEVADTSKEDWASGRRVVELGKPE